MSKLSRRQFLEIRRSAGERWLQTRHGRGWRIRLAGGRAIVSGWEGGLEVVLPIGAILEPDGLRRRGF